MPLIGRLLSRRIFTLYQCSLTQFSAFQIKATICYPPPKIYCTKYPHRTYVQESNISRTTTTQKEIGSSSSSSSSSDESDHNDDWSKEEKLRLEILEAGLSFVEDYGWTTDAIARGAESLGYSSMVHGMFDKGGTDLVNYFYSRCNSRLESELQILEEKQKSEEKKMRTTEIIRTAVQIRLRMNTQYKDSWAKALVLHASPTNLSTSFNNFGTLIDTIWYYAGDRSHDFNWYTKRAFLAAVYKSTELCLLQDNSEDFEDTWNFLDRRLSEAKFVVNCVKQTNQRTKDLYNIFDVTLITVANIWGLNTKSRR